MLTELTCNALRQVVVTAEGSQNPFFCIWGSARAAEGKEKRKAQLEEKGLCQPIPIDEDFGICEHSPLDHLLLVLAAVLVGQLEMKDAHIFALKAWLIKRADEFQDNDFLEIGLKSKNNSEAVDLLARIGKDESGQVVFWHLGLPWPNCWAA